jgi:DNA polymerase-3 subunit alpha
LKEFSQDVVCLSGPIGGEISYYILSGKSQEDVYKRIQEYQEIFGVENYFLELLYHHDIPKQQLVTDTLIEIHKQYTVPVVACQNSYYIDKDDKLTQDVIMALGTGHEIENPDRPTLTRGDYSFLSEEEMQEIFGYIPEALENTGKIADMVDIHIETGGILIPTFELPDDMQALFEEANVYQKKNPGKTPKKDLSSDEWYLRYLSYAGLNWRYKDNISKEILFELVQKIDMPGLQTPLVETAPEELKSLSLTYY